jgi:hypothetical protein
MMVFVIETPNKRSKAMNATAKKTRRQWDTIVLVGIVKSVREAYTGPSPWAEVARQYSIKRDARTSNECCQRYFALAKQKGWSTTPFKGQLRTTPRNLEEIRIQAEAAPTHAVDKAAAGLRTLLEFLIAERMHQIEQRVMHALKTIGEVDRSLDERIRKIVEDMFK